MNNKANDVLKIITSFYLKSNDFNGISTGNLSEKIKQDWTLLRAVIKKLILNDLVVLIDENTDINPHILRVGFEPKNIQLARLKGETTPHSCLYPAPTHLLKVVNQQEYSGQPYKLCLALGEAQLAYRNFDLSVLEFYRNDPRYRYKNDDIRGQIECATDDMNESDKLLLKAFGFSYDDDYNRAVAVFLRDLTFLTSEHQQIWKAKELQGNFKLHPDYYRNAIIGDWGEKEPICSAILTELYIINKMTKAMGKPPLFNDDYGEYAENKPKRFGFLIRPTLDEYNSFMLLFDKMLSENINREFFQQQVPYENEIVRNDGKIQIQSKGTLQILDDWIRKAFRTSDWQPWDKSLETLRKIRKVRQSPAHSVSEDQFDQKYFKEQREIIIAAYSAVRTLRLMFANHPLVKNACIEIPDWLQEGKLWTM